MKIRIKVSKSCKVRKTDWWNDSSQWLGILQKNDTSILSSPRKLVKKKNLNALETFIANARAKIPTMKCPSND